jgi:serine/threonine protein kinase
LGLREAFFLQKLASNTESSGSVYIIKLIGVKEDGEQRRTSLHGRSSSDAFPNDPPRARNLTRQRSSTNATDPRLASSPSLSAIAQAARTTATPSVSRLVLLLEHAPLGTMDGLLRSSPNLVGRDLWERWAIQSVQALAWVHGKGIVHADVKPGNLLVGRKKGTCNGGS